MKPMKTIKRLMTMVLSVIMVMALALPAFAEETTYTITINNSTEDHTYEAYQIFTGDLSGNILSNIDWGNGVNGETLLAALTSDEGTKNHFAGCDSAAKAAEILSKFVKNSEELDAFAAVVGKHLNDTSETSTWNVEKKNYTISGLDAGYYFVKDQDDSVTGNDAYTKFVLELVKDVEITPKSDVPAVEKKVQEDDKYTQDEGYGAGYNDVADWNIGDQVPFKLIGSIPDMDGYDTYKYIFHDTMSAGLTLNEESIKVYLVSDKNAALSEDAEIDEAKYEKKVTGQTFEISFDNLKEVDGAGKGKYIIVAYEAELNTDAVIGLDGNPNEVYLEFSNNPAQSGDGETEENETGNTPEDKVIVFTYELEATKVDGQQTDTPLEDAEFVLLNSEGTAAAKVIDGKFSGWAELTAIDTDNDKKISYEEWTNYNGTNNVILKSDAQGLFSVAGLDDGTYKLREIKAPAGYNLLTDDVEVVIKAATANGQNWTGKAASDALTKLEVTADDKAGTGDVANGTAAITIANNKGATLPSTGGMGTTVFYLAGGILAVGAGVLLIAKRRMNLMEEN